MAGPDQPTVKVRDVWRLEGQPVALAVVVRIEGDLVTTAAALPGDWTDDIPANEILPAPVVAEIALEGWEDPISVTAWPSLVFELPRHRIGRLVARDGPQIIPQRTYGGLLDVIALDPALGDLIFRFVGESAPAPEESGNTDRTGTASPTTTDGPSGGPQLPTRLAEEELTRLPMNEARQALGLTPEQFGQLAQISDDDLIPTLRGLRPAELPQRRRVEQALHEADVDPRGLLSDDEETAELDAPDIAPMIESFAQRRQLQLTEARSYVRDQLRGIAARDRGDSLQQRVQWIIDDNEEDASKDAEEHDDGR